MAANAKLVPIAGVTLPFLSYGGSSLLATFVALGLILRISSPETRQPVPRRLNFTPLSARVRSLRVPLLHLAFVLGLGLAVLAVACGYWSVWRAGWLTAREDNPRRVVYEQHVVRGEIVDRGDTVLAGVEVGPEGIVTRTYPMPEAAPVVGYASLRYGTGGVEAAFDALLRGEAARSAQEAAWDELLHRPPVGQDVQLSVQADVQRLAQDALAGHTGAVVLLDAQTGEVLAMASAPTFDPARLEEVWDQLREDPAAPLVNRATQGLYQPGAALETVVLAEALERDLVYPSDPVSHLTDTVRVDGAALGCLEEPPVGGSLLDAYQAACPGPFTTLGEALAEEGLSSAVAGWGLTTPPPLEVPTESGAWAPDDLALEGVGQGELTVSPLQMALVAATLANEGVMPVPRLVLATEDVDGGWQSTEVSGAVRPVTREDIVQTLFLGWRGYGPDVLGHLGTAVAGEERPPHAWFLGVAPAGRPQYALAVLLEHPEDPQDAAAIGREVLEAVLDP
jgi:peptidoglycan glycosyltransferase